MSESRKNLLSDCLIQEIKSFPLRRGVEHCSNVFYISPFKIYATCPHCGLEIKVRSFSSVTEVEDVFDAVFESMSQPGALHYAQERQEKIKEDSRDS